MNLETLPMEVWPQVELAPIAQLSLMPSELSDMAGIQFRRLEDDLGPLDVAVVKAPSGEIFVLERYVSSPAAGTAVSVEASQASRKTLNYLLNALAAPSEAVTWVTPAIGEPRDNAGVVPLPAMPVDTLHDSDRPVSVDDSLRNRQLGTQDLTNPSSQARVLLDITEIDDESVRAKLNAWLPNELVTFPVSVLTTRVRQAVQSRGLPVFVTIVANLSATSPQSLDLHDPEPAPLIYPADDLILRT
jgi:hypothetical protein